MFELSQKLVPCHINLYGHWKIRESHADYAYILPFEFAQLFEVKNKTLNIVLQ
jgi:hypothetical protein